VFAYNKGYQHRKAKTAPIIKIHHFKKGSSKKEKKNPEWLTLYDIRILYTISTPNCQARGCRQRQLNGAQVVKRERMQAGSFASKTSVGGLCACMARDRGGLGGCGPRQRPSCFVRQIVSRCNDINQSDDGCVIIDCLSRPRRKPFPYNGPANGCLVYIAGESKLHQIKPYHMPRPRL
jgi:hypothetical protein